MDWYNGIITGSVRMNFFNPFPSIIDVAGGTFANPWSAACMENVQSVLSHYQAHQLKSMFQGVPHAH